MYSVQNLHVCVVGVISAADPRTLFILAEDASALLSCAVGAFCLMMAEWMALPLWDAVGTTCVAFILSMQVINQTNEFSSKVSKIDLMLSTLEF
jgi:hypothetical protein